MNEKFKAFLASKGITESDYATKSVEEMARLQSEYVAQTHKALEDAIDKAANKDELAKVKKEFNDFVDGMKEFNMDAYKTLEKAVKTQGTELAKLKEKGLNPGNESFRENIVKQLTAHKETLETMKNNQHTSVEIKAVAAMTFATHTTGNVGRTERDSTIVRDLRRTPMLLDIVNVGNTNAANYEWIEKTGREGGVAMVAEGAVKPQGDFDLQLFSQKPKKEAIIITVSKEMLDDIEGMAMEIENEINEALRLFTDDIILTGDGTGNNIIGIDNNATPYVAGAFANQVVAANTFDVIRTAINQVELNNDFPNYVLMHPSDATLMELEKDATTSQYILPPFATANGTIVKGLPIKTSVVVTQGELYVGNFNRFKVRMREDINLTMGYRGAAGDWEKNMISFLGEARLFGFIPANHYGSIVKADIEVAKALLDPAVADS